MRTLSMFAWMSVYAYTEKHRTNKAYKVKMCHLALNTYSQIKNMYDFLIINFFALEGKASD